MYRRRVKTRVARSGTLFPLLSLLLLLTGACASIGRPGGGPRDEDPPRYVRSNPAPDATGFSGTRLTIDFDEIVNLKDAFSQVVVSPPSGTTPRVSSLGRRVTVDFGDTLQPNTTYTIDFGNSIQDNNESNALEGYLFRFSTGDVLDTLALSGMVLGAADLEPQQGLYVGLHSNVADSAFRRLRFERIAKTDEYGRFIIEGLKEGVYRVYALADKDNDLRYSSPEEEIAFMEVTVSPRAERIETSDTIYNLRTGEVDTVKTRMRTKYLPDNLLLRSFASEFKQQYISNYERIDSTRISLVFNSRASRLPGLWLDGREVDEDMAVVEHSAGNDSVTIWLRNPHVIARDTLRLRAVYMRPDSAMNYSEVSDTLRLITRRDKVVKPKKRGKSDKEKEDTVAPVVPTISFSSVTGTQDIERPFLFWTEVPLARLDTAAIHLESKAPGDTVWTALPTPPVERADTLSPRRLQLRYPWKYDTSYRVTVDSLAATSIYGLHSAPYQAEVRVRPESEYASIRFRIRGVTDSIPMFVELLNASDSPVRSVAVDEHGDARFTHLTSGSYNARIVMDRNGNGRWDAGNFDTGILPDLVYYYPKTVKLKQNWDQEIDWNVFATPVDRQKPASLVRNKPKNAAPSRPEEESEEEEGNGYNPADPFRTSGRLQ